MLIVGSRIVDANLLRNADKDHIRSASYYLTVDSIIPAGEQARNYDVRKPLRNYTIKPGGLAWIVSKEIFCIKDFGVTALVTLRSTFTKKGLLALDVGLVDANFEGPIGSVIINFSKNDVYVHEGLEFFRVIFFRHDEITEKRHQAQTRTLTHESYATERLADLVEGFPATFLQADEIESRIKEKYWIRKSWRNFRID